jgi:large subunit ribosomal protein L17
MRHGDKIKNLSRTASHRKALLTNLAIELIRHKRIVTTLTKAKSLRTWIEPILTKAKSNTTHSRRIVFSYLQNKEAAKELFDVIAEKIAARPGGYTRVIKLGIRTGDNVKARAKQLHRRRKHVVPEELKRKQLKKKLQHLQQKRPQHLRKKLLQSN